MPPAPPTFRNGRGEADGCRAAAGEPALRARLRGRARPPPLVSERAMNPLGLHLPDRDVLTDDELQATRGLRPSHLLALAYEADKGQAEQVNALVAELG